MSCVSPEQRKRKRKSEDDGDKHKKQKKHKKKQASEEDEDMDEHRHHKKHKLKKSKHHDSHKKEKKIKKHLYKKETPSPHESDNRKPEKHQTKQESESRKHGSISPEVSILSGENDEKYSRLRRNPEKSSKESDKYTSQLQNDRNSDNSRNLNERRYESRYFDNKQESVQKKEKRSRWSADDRTCKKDESGSDEVRHHRTSKSNRSSKYDSNDHLESGERKKSKERSVHGNFHRHSDNYSRELPFPPHTSHHHDDDRHVDSLPKQRSKDRGVAAGLQSSRAEGGVSQEGKGEGEEAPDYDFDFSQHKAALNRIFFRDQDLISRGSKDYEDFWAFLTKYQAFQKKKAQSDGNTKSKAAVESETCGKVTTLDIPGNYDRRYRINLCLMSKEAEDFIKRGRLVDYEVQRELTRQRVSQFRGILLHYLDFNQKQKFQKLRKIRHDQKNLPIFQYKDKIVSMVNQHQIVVVAGDTGCGKSTQMPQYLLEAGFDKIACTQPRRIACISLAKRVGYETLNEYGSRVAYQVRFEKTKTQATRIVFLTEGLLLRQMSGDQLLSQYSVIVVDEVHERHIHTDFLLGVFKCLLKMRKDLKLVLMSATINISLFSQYFDGAPVIKVPGRLYPIEMEYCPFKPNNELYSARPQKLDPTPYIRILQLIDSKYPPTERGDVLIFLSGMTEIMTVVEAAKLYAEQMKRWIILPLHSALSVEEQEKVFDYPPEGVRKCIVSTNIAETSVTIDGVRFVVDSGKVKEMSFDPKYKMQRLKEFWISRASSEQRKGRAGRTGPGVCFRLYGESDYDEFQAYSTPEIQRVPLDSLVLQLIAMGLPNVRKFPFIEPPDLSSLENSVRFLKEQGALAGDESLTPVGQMLSMLPVDVVIGKMLIMGSIFHMVDPVLSIAAAMSVQSPFTGKAHINHDAIAARKTLESEHGDPLTLLNAFDEWIQVKTEGRGTKNWCRRRCLEEQRFYEMTKLKRQFRDLLKDHNLLDQGVDHRQSFTSEERRQRHGERKRLNQLKRQQQHERKKRKVLTMEDEDMAISAGEEDQGEDIKDLEFRLTHDLNQLQERSNRSRSLTLRDINVLKVILCSGIFPQVALSDDCNSFKGDSEQAFHTKNKPFILLHPTSVFAYQPGLLKAGFSAPEKHEGPSELKGRLGTHHQLLAYGSLLETNNKPYLVNCMRVPALQTLTLFTNSIDTNADCTRLVCDGWLEVRFPDAESAEPVLSSILSLRSTWQHLMQLRLEDTFQSLGEDRQVSPRARQLERVLSQKLAEFLDSRVPYAIRRVMAAETQHLYVGPGHKVGQSVGMKMFGKTEDELKEHPAKGGWQINAYLTYNCLLDEASASVWGQYTSHMQRHWTCPHCRQSMIVSVLERLQHEDSCHSDPDAAAASGAAAEEEEEDEGSSSNPLKQSYHCDVCDKTLRLTATQILKHRKSHTQTSTEGKG